MSTTEPNPLSTAQEIDQFVEQVISEEISMSGLQRARHAPRALAVGMTASVIFVNMLARIAAERHPQDPIKRKECLDESVNWFFDSVRARATQ